MGEFTISTIPPSWWMIAGCVSTYIGSALRGFQLKLSGTCTQFPTEIKVGKQINMHGGKQSSKPTSPHTRTFMTPTGPMNTLRMCTHSGGIYAAIHHIHTHTALHKHKRARLQYMTVHTNTLQSNIHIQCNTVSIPDSDNCRRCSSKDNISHSFRISIFIF